MSTETTQGGEWTWERLLKGIVYADGPYKGGWVFIGDIEDERVLNLLISEHNERLAASSRLAAVEGERDKAQRKLEYTHREIEEIRGLLEVPVGISTLEAVKLHVELVIADLQRQLTAAQEAGKALADYIHGGLAECAYCGLSHAHMADCLVGKWIFAGGKTQFSLSPIAGDHPGEVK